MFKLIVVSALLAVAAAKPTQLFLNAPTFYAAAPIAHITPLATPILSQYHAQDALGQYTYGYNNELSSKIETKSFDGTTRGAYSYVDPKGELQSVEYSADAINGFRVAASNLPVAPIDDKKAPMPVMDTPEVAQAKADHFKAIDEAKARNDAAPEPAIEAESAELEKPALISSPALIQLKSDLAPAPLAYSSYSIQAPSYAYSVGSPYYYSHMPYASYHQYATPLLARAGAYPYLTPIIARSAEPTIEALPEPVQDTPEVAQAKVDHFKAVEEAKARNA